MSMTVGQVAKRSGINVSTLHFYEEKGLIVSTRDHANRRRYDRQILRRIAVIKAAQNIGLSLQEISEALSDLPKHRAPKQEEWEKLAKEWEQILEQKIQALRSLQTKLGSCINCGCLSLGSCELYNPEDSKGIYEPGARLVTKDDSSII